MTVTAERPPLIGSLTDLHEHLQAALELEHGTIPPYLCALYSIRPGRNTDAIEIIRTVVVQEMLHMVLVANVMNAVGARPSIDYPAFVPRYPIGLPLGDGQPLIVHLHPFSSTSLETFLNIERPAAPLAHLSYMAYEAVSVPPGQLAEMVRAGTLYASIGEFYAAIAHGLEALEREAMADGRTIFTPDDTRQVGPEHFYGAGGTAAKVHDLASALAALNVIVGQGEGYGEGTACGDVVGGEREIGHYYRFDQLRQGRRYVATDPPGRPSGATIDVDFGPDAVFPMMTDPSVAALPAGPFRRRGAAFAACYTGLLRLLQEGFDGDPAQLLKAGVAMFDLKRLALDLIANPIGGASEQHAGPCFEFVETAD